MLTKFIFFVYIVWHQATNGDQRLKRIEKSQFGSIRLNLYIIENLDFCSFVVLITYAYGNGRLGQIAMNT